MNKKIIAAIASVALVSGFGTTTVTGSQQMVQAARKARPQKYANRFYKVKITKKVALYKATKVKGRTKYKKSGYLKPGKVVYIRSIKGANSGWYVGKNRKAKTYEGTHDYSWFDVDSSEYTITTKVIEVVPDDQITDTTPKQVLSDEDKAYFSNQNSTYEERYQRALSLPEDQKHAAEDIMMKELHLTFPDGRPMVPYSNFETQMNKKLQAYMGYR